MSQSAIDRISRELRELWESRAPMETIEAVEHQLLDSVLSSAREAGQYDLIDEMEDLSPQCIFYEPEHVRLRSRFGLIDV